ncbi:MAG: hypothetical protein FWH04_07960 [Oscillospiraceae bacterium]|nr:hypothetical protein [Oscillospiraceae bacterium]
MAKQEPADSKGRTPGISGKKNVKPRVFKPGAIRWAILVTGWSMAISFVLSLVSGSTISGWGFTAALSSLILFVLLGIVFDLLGMAVATVSERPFHSMAAKRVDGAAQALRLIARAERVTNFCADVVGDISGIIAGVTGTTVATILVEDFGLHSFFTSLIMSALVSGTVIGGKAVCKNIAIAKNVEIVHAMGRFIGFFSRKNKR